MTNIPDIGSQVSPNGAYVYTDSFNGYPRWSYDWNDGADWNMQIRYDPDAGNYYIIRAYRTGSAYAAFWAKSADPTDPTGTYAPIGYSTNNATGS